MKKFNLVNSYSVSNKQPIGNQCQAFTKFAYKGVKQITCKLYNSRLRTGFVMTLSVASVQGPSGKADWDSS